MNKEILPPSKGKIAPMYNTFIDRMHKNMPVRAFTQLLSAFSMIEGSFLIIFWHAQKFVRQLTYPYTKGKNKGTT